MKKLLLHVCCAPCSTSVIEELKNKYDVYLFFYNPNIHPLKEQELREKEMLDYSKKLGIQCFFQKGDISEWFKMVKNYKWATEKGGERCYLCYRDRLTATAIKAKELNYNLFATTLTISPYKHLTIINDLGTKIGNEYGVDYLESNFKKDDGYLKSVKMSNAEGLYRQNYCGCVFSKLERLGVKPYNKVICSPK